MTFCASCGAARPDDKAAFCSGCGAAFTGPIPVTRTPAATDPTHAAIRIGEGVSKLIIGTVIAVFAVVAVAGLAHGFFTEAYKNLTSSESSNAAASGRTAPEILSAFRSIDSGWCTAKPPRTVTLTGPQFKSGKWLLSCRVDDSAGADSLIVDYMRQEGAKAPFVSYECKSIDPKTLEVSTVVFSKVEACAQ